MKFVVFCYFSFFDVIVSISDPPYMLRGNLSPNGAICRPTAVPPEMKTFRGPAKIFDSDQAATAALEAGKVVPGDVIVIRYEGCKKIGRAHV